MNRTDKNVLKIVEDVCVTVATIHKTEFDWPDNSDQVREIVSRYDSLSDEAILSLTDKEQELLLVSHTTHDVLRECVKLLRCTTNLYQKQVVRKCSVCRNEYPIPAGVIIQKVEAGQPIPLRCGYCNELVNRVVGGLVPLERIDDLDYRESVKIHVERIKKKYQDNRKSRGYLDESIPSPEVGQSAECSVPTGA